MGSEEVYKKIIEKLERVRRKKLISLFAEKFILFLSFSLVVFYAATLSESVFRFSAGERNVIFFLLISAVILLMVLFFAKPFSIMFGIDRSLNSERLALGVGYEFKDVRDRLLNAVQIYSNKDIGREGYSEELIDQYVKKIGEELLGRDFNRTVDFKLFFNRLKIFGVVFCVGTLMFGIFYDTFGEPLKRVFQPDRDFPVKVNFSISIEPGNLDVLRGEEIAIGVKIDGEIPNIVNLYIREDGEDAFRGVELEEIPSTADDDYVYRIERIKRSFEYYAEATDEMLFQRDRSYATDIYNIGVIYRPVIRKLKVRLDFPSYSKLGSRYLDDNIGDITALKGTEAFFDVFVNKDISEGNIVFENKEPLSMDVRNNNLKADFVIDEDDKYRLIVKDSEGITNEDPIDYFISTVYDHYPAVEIVEPGKDIDLEEGMKVPLYFRISDDFGFSRLGLKFTKNPSETEFLTKSDSIDADGYEYLALDIFNSAELSQNFTYEWDLSRLLFIPEDEVLYFIEIYDNDEISGPKRGMSETYRIRFPSLAEIYSKVNELQNSSIDDMEEIFERNSELKKKLDEIELEMRRNLDLNWEEKKELKNIAKEQAELRKKLDDIKKSIEELTEKLEKNDLSAIETLRKYAELQNLIDEIATPEFKKVMEELRKSFEKQLNSQEMRNLVNRMKLSQDELLKRIERTMNIMKQIRTEQKLDEVIRRAEDLLKRQEAVRKEIENREDLRDADAEKLAEDEEKIRDSADELRSRMEETAEDMSSDAMMPSKKMNSSIEMFDNRNITGKMSRMAGDIMRNETKKAGKSGKEIEGDLTELSENLRAAQEEMIGAQKEMIRNAMLKSAMSLLNLSKKEEELSEESSNLDKNSSRFISTAEKQLDILSGLARTGHELIELSQKTFFVTPDMGRALAGAVLNMQKSIRELEGRNIKQAVSAQVQSLMALNMTIEEIRKSLKSLESASSGSGLEEYLKRLEEMAGKQQGLNEQASELSMGLEPGLAEQARMLRIAREQEALRRVLEELRNEMGRRSEILGDIDRIEKDMRDAANDLRNKRFDRKTSRTMERILSRLLDAQHSLRQRDYSKKRKSETAKEYLTLSPSELLWLGEKDNELREELLKALSEGYSRDFVEVIRKYFQSLSEINFNNDR